MNGESHFLAGGGELGALMRARDWSATPLGPIERWPQSLRSAVSILLPSKAQIALFWGEDLITLYNDAYRPVFGAKHPRALGQPIREAWDELWRAGLKELFDGVLTTGEAFWAKDHPFFMGRHGYVEETYFDVSYDPVRDESGRVGGVFCIVSETTGRVLGDRRLRALRDLGNVAPRAGTVSEVYRLAAEALAPYREDVPFFLLYGRDEAGGPHRLCCSGMAADDGPAWSLGDTVAILGAAELAPYAELHAGPWPEPVAQVAILPLAQPGNQPVGHLVCGISPRRRLDEDYRGFLQLAAANIASALAAAQRAEDERRRIEALAEIDRAKTAFFSNVSHEFRTPLTLMLGPVEDALADGGEPLPPRQRERLELVRRSGLRLQKLVNSLLDFSRIEAGRARASFVPTDLAAFTAELASTFRSAVEKAGLALDVDCPPLPEPVYVDRDMWEKIVLNLLSNAFKFTFDGGITVALRPADGHVELTVSDTGTGIPAAELPHVFERFRRVEGARSRTHEGTGIGLALVQELAKQHGAAVRAHSVEGAGSRFTVSVPLGSAHLPQDRIGTEPLLASTAVGAESFVEEALRWLPEAPAESKYEDPSPPAAHEPRARIVWADDNSDMREYVRRLLSRRYEVEAVADGEAALAAIRRRCPDLLLADVMMPGLDGLALVRALRGDPSTQSLPTILLSARAGEEARIDGLGAGADSYLFKPFSARELLAEVAARLELRRLQSRLEQQRSLLASLFAQTPVPLAVVTGPQLVFELATVSYIEVVGGRKVVGKPLLEALPEMKGQGYDRLLHEVMRTGVPYVGHEQVVRLEREGTTQDVYFNFIYAPLRNHEGDIDSVIAICNDVTQQVHARDVLMEADRRKDEFLATLAHELRNPLAPLRNLLQLLRLDHREEALTPRVYEMMQRQLDHLVRLVDDLLEVSRINRGTLELRRESVDLATVVRTAVETCYPLIQAGGHEFSMSLPDRPAWLDADHVRLSQILSNLLNNAAKYTGRGGRIRMAARVDGAWAVVSVQDNGMGIPREQLPHIFEMFNRGAASGAEVQGGLGIGLALARRLAEMHGGTIEARSEGPGRGSEFVVRLPLAAADSRKTAAPEDIRAVPPKRILVIDDNADAGDSLAMLLQFLGAEVHVARGGREGINAFEQYAPDIVLLDIGMPDMDGYRVARELKARHPHSRATIVALTGWGQEEDRRQAMDAGFDVHLTKPVDMEALRAVLVGSGQGLGEGSGLHGLA